MLLSAKDKACPACFPAGKKEVLGSAELGTEMRGQEDQKRSKRNLQAQGCTPSSWVPEGTPEVKVRLRGWGREPAGAETCGVSDSIIYSLPGWTSGGQDGTVKGEETVVPARATAHSG